MGEKIPTMLKPIMALVVLLLLPRLYCRIIPILFFHAFIWNICDIVWSLKPHCLNRIMGLIFIMLPCMIVLVALFLLTEYLFFKIFIIPGYLLTFVQFVRMFAWWFRTKRVKDNQLTEEQ